MDNFWPAIETLIPSIGILGLFYIILRHIMEGDRRERVAQAQWERDRDLEKGSVAPGEAEAHLQNAHLPKARPRTMDSRDSTLTPERSDSTGSLERNESSPRPNGPQA